MTRLPQPGSDSGAWGSILNDFLNVEHNADGSLKIRSDGTFYAKPSGGIPASDLSSAVQSALSDATTTSKGIVQLAGDLGGTASAPTVPGLAGKVNTSTVTTKGDLFVATGSGTVTRLAAGTNGQFLQADNTQFTGLNWTSATDTMHVTGLVADGVTDDGPAIQTVLDSIGVSGNHSYEVFVEAPPTGIIYINSTVQIQSDNTILRFGSPVLYGASGRIRIQGELAETPASNKPQLTVAATAGASSITLGDVSPFVVGCYIVIRGARDTTGNPLDTQKEYNTVTAISGNTLTLGTPLQNSYATYNPNPGAPAGFSHATEVTRAITSGITSAANRGDRTITVSDTSIYTVGDIVQIIDDTHTITPTGTTETSNYKHREIAEVKQVVSATQIRISHALHHTYTLANNARVAKVLPVKHSSIKDANISWGAMATVNNAIEINFGVQSSIINCRVTGDSAKTKSWLKQAFRQTDSYFCQVSGCYATDPANTDSGSGYGATLYGSTYCQVVDSRFSSCRHSVLFFNGASGNVASNCISEDVCISDYDLHGAECLDNLVTGCVAIGGDSAATDGSVNKTACKVGNTTHTDGDFHNVFSNMLIINYQGAAFEVVPASGDNTFRDSRVNGAWYGIKLVANSNNTALISANTFIENVDFADISTALTNINGNNGTSMIQGLTIESCRFIRATTGLAVSYAQTVRVRRNSYYDPNMPAGTYALTATSVTGFSAKHNDFSGAVRGVKLASSPNARVYGNILHDMTDTKVIEDAGGNTGLLFARNEIYGFTPTVFVSGTASVGGVISTETLYQTDTPSRHSYIEWNYDPVVGGSGSQPTTGTIYVLKVSAQTGGTISNIIMTITSATGVSLTSGQNFVGLYDSSGARIGISSDQTTSWATSGLKTMALTASATIQAGNEYYVAMLCVGTTTPSFMRSGTNLTAPNAGQSNALQRFSVNGTSQTALPASITLSSNTASGAATFWVALS